MNLHPQGMNLEYKTKDSPNTPQVVRVEFDPPLLGYEEVKPRLLGMKADADEALGTVRKKKAVTIAIATPSPSLATLSTPPRHLLSNIIFTCRLRHHRSTISRYPSRSGPPAPLCSC
jgi:Protein of unknown function (DUF2470)